MTVIWNVCPPAAADTHSHELFSADVLGDIAAALGNRDTLDSIPDGIYIGTFTSRGKPLSVIKADSMVCHIGYSIFTEDMRKELPSPFYDVLERNALIKDIPGMKRQRTVDQEFEERGVVFRKGSLKMLPSLFGRPEIKFNLYNYDGKKYHAIWADSDRVVCEIEMPYTYEFLKGTEMDENERRLVDGLSRLRPYAFANDSLAAADVDNCSVLPYHTSNLYILPGESYYLEGLNANRFYQMSDSGALYPVYAPEFPIESLSNLCTAAEVPNKISVEVKVVKYGFKKAFVEVPLTSMVDYFRKSGTTPFFGIIETGPDATVCEVVFRNTAEGYCHILKMTAPAETIGKREGKFTARLNSFIPISKIENLFDDK